MRNAQTITLIVRVVFVLLCLSVAVLTLGSFQGAEAYLGLNDKMAHAIAFYVFTLFLLAGLPRLRRTDALMIALMAGALIEVAQMFVGRSGSVSDWLCDAAGAVAAILPTYVLQLRQANMPRRRASDAQSGRQADAVRNNRTS